MNQIEYIIAQEALELLFKTIKGLVAKSDCIASQQGADVIMNHVRKSLKPVELPEPADTKDKKEELKKDGKA